MEATTGNLLRGQEKPCSKMWHYPIPGGALHMECNVHCALGVVQHAILPMVPGSVLPIPLRAIGGIHVGDSHENWELSSFLTHLMV